MVYRNQVKIQRKKPKPKQQQSDNNCSQKAAFCLHRIKCQFKAYWQAPNVCVCHKFGRLLDWCGVIQGGPVFTPLFKPLHSLTLNKGHEGGLGWSWNDHELKRSPPRSHPNRRENYELGFAGCLLCLFLSFSRKETIKTIIYYFYNRLRLYQHRPEGLWKFITLFVHIYIPDDPIKWNKL